MKNIKLVAKAIILIMLFISTVSCGQSEVKSEVKAVPVYNRLLANQLDSIMLTDQQHRQKVDGVREKYGAKSKEMMDLWKIIHEQDSINVIQVTAILDQHGWLGIEEVGKEANSCLFLVIQHSDQQTQEKYLPLMREAVKNGKALGSHLAYLEDRVALGQGKKQLYGSQLRMNEQTNQYSFAPIEDERNVNKRRAAVGLDKLENYAREWGLEYKVPE